MPLRIALLMALTLSGCTSTWQPPLHETGLPIYTPDELDTHYPGDGERVILDARDGRVSCGMGPCRLGFPLGEKEREFSLSLGGYDIDFVYPNRLFTRIILSGTTYKSVCPEGKFCMYSDMDLLDTDTLHFSGLCESHGGVAEQIRYPHRDLQWDCVLPDGLRCEESELTRTGPCLNGLAEVHERREQARALH